MLYQLWKSSAKSVTFLPVEHLLGMVSFNLWPWTTVLQYVHALLCLCWDKDYVNLDKRDASIVAVYQKQSLASRLCPEFQYGFMFGQSSVDMIFALRQPLLEKCLEQWQPLFIAFVGETFDLVSKRWLLKILLMFGCPPKTARHQLNSSTWTCTALSTSRERHLWPSQ